MNNECISVIRFVNDDAVRLEHRRSPRFCSFECFHKKMNEVSELACLKLDDSSKEIS